MQFLQPIKAQPYTLQDQHPAPPFIDPSPPAPGPRSPRLQMSQPPYMNQPVSNGPGNYYAPPGQGQPCGAPRSMSYAPPGTGQGRGPMAPLPQQGGQAPRYPAYPNTGADRRTSFTIFQLPDTFDPYRSLRSLRLCGALPLQALSLLSFPNP
jgi:hypothetical protein